MTTSSLIIVLCWTYVILYNTNFIKSNFIDNLVQVVLSTLIFFIALFTVKRIKIDLVFILYLLVVFYVSFVDVIINRGSLNTVVLSYLLPITMYWAITSYYHKKELPRIAFNIPVFFAITISAWTLLGVALKMIGFNIGSEVVYIEKFGNYMEVFNYGFGTYSAWGSIAGRQLYRIQSFFIEPSKMAMFLIIPFFILKYSRLNKKTVFKTLGLIIISVAILFTMSRAGIIAILGSMLIGKTIKTRLNKTQAFTKTNPNDFLKLLFGLISFVLVAVMFVVVLVVMSKYLPDFDFLYSGITNVEGQGTLIRSETVDSSYLFEHFKKYPFGSGFSSVISLNKETNLANALIFWIAIGGIPALTIILVLLFRILYYYYVPAIKSHNFVANSIAHVFLGLTVHSLSYGTWLSPEYMIILAFMVVVTRKGFYDSMFT